MNNSAKEIIDFLDRMKKLIERGDYKGVIDLALASKEIHLNPFEETRRDLFLAWAYYHLGVENSEEKNDFFSKAESLFREILGRKWLEPEVRASAQEGLNKSLEALEALEGFSEESFSSGVKAL